MSPDAPRELLCPALEDGGGVPLGQARLTDQQRLAVVLQGAALAAHLESLGRRTQLEKPATSFEISLPVDRAEGDQTLDVSLVYYYCREGKGGVCKVGRVTWQVPVEVSPEARATVVPLAHKVR